MLPIASDKSDLDFIVSEAAKADAKAAKLVEAVPPNLTVLSPLDIIEVKGGAFTDPADGLTYDEARDLAGWMLKRPRFAMPWNQGSARLFLPKDWPAHISGDADLRWRCSTTLGAWANRNWIPRETKFLLLGAFRDAARWELRQHYDLAGVEVPQPIMPSV